MTTLAMPTCKRPLRGQPAPLRWEYSSQHTRQSRPDVGVPVDLADLAADIRVAAQSIGGIGDDERVGSPGGERLTVT